ncbi:ATP-dependent DNA ligase [Nocardioides sp.]|uniref:ATP-dependent DNA ligase n=1 Tax=Nocardioides sp. TaxID=35761 RepID=UPI0035192790
MLLADVVATSAAVAATRSRKEKAAHLAALLARADAGEIEIVLTYLAGAIRQRRTGVGWRSLADLPPPASAPTLEVVAVDATLERLGTFAGPGSAGARTAALAALLSAATDAEQDWLRRVLTGNVRQGASDALAQEALAAVTSLPLAAVRRAAMLAGSTAAIARLAVEQGAAGLAEVGVQVLRPVSPMLAASAPSVSEALAGLGGRGVVEAKLDGIRIQAHRDGDEVVLATRSLDDVTARLPEVVEVVRALPAQRLILDGEVLTGGPDGRPRPFQETSSRTASAAAADADDAARVTPFFFDLLHLDGRDLLDAPTTQRRALLEELVSPDHRVGSLLTDSPAEAEEFTASVLAAGHEGVVVKAPDAGYEAGRRGAAWIKVKPVHTLDLVVIGVEHGSGRRRGWLSNLHLAARDPDGGPPIMVGKTFKGLTDATLAWQTERFRELALDDDGWTVTVRPEQVVEIAVDGVQRSTRYPGGVALRFARVVRYREDKSAEEADTIKAVRALGAT